MKFQKHTLENGLTLIGETRDEAVSAALGFFVKTGARDESPEVSGVSHFLEHMMFKGTHNRSALDVTFQLGAIGAQANAWTSEENTVYYMGLLPEYFETGLELLSDMLRPSLDPEEFKTEKKVILEEIALYKDRPVHVLFESSLAEFFKGHTAGNSVLGSTESVSQLERDKMLDYFNARYTPSNMVFVATGKVDWEKTVELVEKHCSSWQDFSVEREYREDQPEDRSKVIRKKDLQGSHVCFVVPGPSAADSDRYAVQLLTCMLGDSSGSAAYWEIVDKGLAEVAVIDSDQMDRTGLIYAYSSCEPDKLSQVSEILAGILKNPKNFISEEAFDRAKTKLTSRLVLHGETSMRRLMAVGTGFIYRGEYSSLKDEVQALEAVQYSDVVKVLEKFDLSPVTKIELLPE